MSETEAATIQERAAAHFMPKGDVSESDEQEQLVEPEAEQPELEADSEDEAPEESAAEEEAPVELEEVEFEGERYQVPPKLKDALMAQSDYTAKTTELARSKETLALAQQEVALFQEARAFEQSVAEDVDNLKMLDAYIAHQKQELVNGFERMDSNDILRKQLELGQYEDQKKQLEKVLQDKRSQFSQKLNAEREKLKKSANETLSKSIPGWGDELRAEIEKDLASRGYPEVAIKNLTPLDYQVAYEAAQYRKLKSGTQTALKKASQTPPVVKPGASNPMPKDVKEKLSFKKQLDRATKQNLPEAQRAKIIQQRLEQKLGRLT